MKALCRQGLAGGFAAPGEDVGFGLGVVVAEDGFLISGDHHAGAAGRPGRSDEDGPLGASL